MTSDRKRMRAALLRWYARHGRHSLPWRSSRDPYRVLVSEFMLQQTQVERVKPIFEAFVARFASFEELAAARTSDVVRAWRGLGYNSRAVRVHDAARAVVERFGGTLPSDTQSLRSLPGLGAYTSAAVRAFAFDMADAAVDTNVRRIVHRVFFGIEHPPKVTAAVLDAVAAALVPRRGGHDWNSAMMDLGAAICTARAPKCPLCPVRPYCAAAPVDASALAASRARRRKREAVPFEQSTRYARGRIVDALRDVPSGKTMSLLQLQRDLGNALDRSEEEVGRVVAALVADGLLESDGKQVALRG